MTDTEKAKAGKAQYMKEYKARNKEKLAAYQKAYMKNYREQYPEKFKEYNDRYFAKVFDRSQENQACLEGRQ
jgi:hypothetical protein